MSATLTEPRFQRTTHLVDLIADAERLATLVASADAAALGALAAERRLAIALSSVQLDGSPLTAPPGEIDVDALPPVHTFEERDGTWLDAMGNATQVADDDVLALEYLGVLRGLDSGDLAPLLLTSPEDALPELHRRITAGLLDDAHAGTPRRSEQAVHDGADGRIIYFPSEPIDVPADLAVATTWLASAGSREHGLILSGVLHHALLRIHPFEAANGRLARCAAGLVLRARGLDPSGVAAPDLVVAQDRLGYTEEVARTVRRRDLTIWLERWGEAVVTGLRRAARDLEVLPAVPVGDDLRSFLDANPRFTIADFRAERGLGPEGARAELAGLLDAGLVAWEPATRGLRYRTT